METQEYKIKDVMKDEKQSAFKKYRAVYYGDMDVAHVILCEIIITLFGWIPGALGLVLRKITYPFMFGDIGRKVVFGRSITIRHPHKIDIGDNVVLDDHCVIDAKGETNEGIEIGDNVYVGRNTIIYCKNGNIAIEDNVNLSSNCQVFSSNKLTLGRDTVIGAFCYFLSGGEYDYTDKEHTFAQQSGTCTKGELTIGPNCWFGARVTVLDAASIGEHCVLAAGAVVTKPIPPNSLAAGVPAKVIKSI